MNRHRLRNRIVIALIVCTAVFAWRELLWMLR